jgi:large subunit ribosomal protein L2
VLKPTSSSKRHYLNIYNKLSKRPTLKILLIKVTNSAGRNNSGKITVRHKGNINKRLYRVVNFRNQVDLIGIVFSLEYDPYRSSHIASIYNIKTKLFLYIIAPNNLKLGDIIGTTASFKVKTGCSIKLDKVPVGCPIYNISLLPNSVGKISRSAGTYSLVINKTRNYCNLIFSSGFKSCLLNYLYCNIGEVSNQFFFLKQLGKAGRSRWLNIRPTVRGVSMNSVDHANGGGEGKKSSNNKSPWGKLQK